MAEQLGKEYACFGHFKCLRCHKKWQSSRAWADFGQKCKSCSVNVTPSVLQKLSVYICKHCNAKWNWAYIPEGIKCRLCSSPALIRPLDPRNYLNREYIKAHELRIDNHIDPNKEHRRDLCQKCQV